MAFSGGKEGHTSQHPNVLVGSRRPNIRRETFWFPALNLKDIPYNGDSRETLDRVYARYVLLKGAFISETIATFVQKAGLIWLEGIFFTSVIQDTNVIVGLKLLTTGTNVTAVLCAQGKKLNLV